MERRESYNLDDEAELARLYREDPQAFWALVHRIIGRVVALAEVHEQMKRAANQE